MNMEYNLPSFSIACPPITPVLTSLWALSRVAKFNLFCKSLLETRTKISASFHFSVNYYPQ